MEIVDNVKKLIKDEVESIGYILDEVLYVKEGSQYFLRVVINKIGIIDLDDCVKVSNLIKPLLDSADIIENNYILDVCSKEKGCE